MSCTGCGVECVQNVTSINASITTLFDLDELLEGSSLRRRATSLARADEVGIIGGCAYTIDDQSRFGELIDMGATSLTTNWPERMLEVARERSSR